MKIKIISPANKSEWGENFWDLKTICKLIGCKATGAPLALPTLAALTPSDVEVVLIDENVEPINFDEKVELVGITGMTFTISRSYEIAREYRERGVPVVMGGIHVSMLPEEAIQHCDSVVIGEAEEVWEQVVREAEKGNLQKYYRAPRFPDLTNPPIPRWDLLKNSKYLCFTIQVGRGCPYNCEFCAVTVFNGQGYRHKPIEQVVKEIDTLQKIDNRKLFFFTDDNFLSNPSYAEQLLKQLANKKVIWMCQASPNKLKNDELLTLMYDAGCREIFAGFESISNETLISMHKSKINKVEEYTEIINKVYSHGIGIVGSFVLGSDCEDETIFEKTEEFIVRNNILFAMINILGPPPGTILRQRLEQEKRLLVKDWNKYNGEFVSFKPKRILPHILQEKRNEIIAHIYSYSKLYERFNHLCKCGVLNRDKPSSLLTKGFFTFLAILVSKASLKRLGFLLKCIWHPLNISITSSIIPVLFALNCHDYSLKILQKHREKRLGQISS